MGLAHLPTNQIAPMREVCQTARTPTQTFDLQTIVGGMEMLLGLRVGGWIHGDTRGGGGFWKDNIGGM